MKITMLLFGFFPSDVRVRKEALSLSNFGHKISVTCCAEKNEQEEYQSIEIPRVGEASDWEGKMTSKQLLKFWIYSFHHLITRRDFDALHCHDLTGLPPAIWFKFLFPKTRIIYDSHEIYPEAVLEKQGFLAAYVFLLLEKFAIKFVNKIIGISLPQQEIMEKRYNIKNFLFLPNFPMKTEFFVGRKSKNEKLKIIYSGGIHRNRGYEEIVEAVNILKDKQDKFVVQLLGDGPHRSKIEKMIKDKNLEELIEVIGSVHYTEVKNFLNSADIGIALYQPTPNNYYGLSNKVFEYTLCGLPLIYPYYAGCSYYLKKIGGINVNPTSPRDIAQKIDFLIENPEVRETMRKAGEKLAPLLVWESVEKDLLDLYDTI
jgi:glycosyltransferase involved in cell wall biosynthesis